MTVRASGSYFSDGRMPSTCDASSCAEAGEKATESAGTTLIEAITYVPTIGGFTVRDLDGRPLGEAALVDIVQLPVQDLAIARSGDSDTAARLRASLATSLRMQLDLGTPLPRPQFSGTASQGLEPATVLSARVIDHRDGGLMVRVTSDERTNEVLRARAPEVAILPHPGADVEIVVMDDGEHCRLRLLDVATIPDDVGRPRSARVRADGRVELIAAPSAAGGTHGQEDDGQFMDSRPILGPYPGASEDDVVLVTAYDARSVRLVSTALPKALLPEHRDGAGG